MNLKELLETRVEENGQRPFLYFRDRAIHFEAFHRDVNRAAGLLRGLGVGKGDPVCLVLRNCPEFLYLWFGLAKIGGIMVPLNVLLPGADLKSIINHSEAKWVIVDEALRDVFSSVRNDLAHIEHKVWHGGTGKPPEGFVALTALMDAAEEEFPCAVDICDEDPAVVFYTPGTTVHPTGVVMSHAHCVNAGMLWARDILGAGEGDLFFTATPLCELNTQFSSILVSLVSGCSNVLQEDFSPSRFFPEVRRWEATIFPYDARIIGTLMNQPETPADTKHPARIAAGTGASQELCESFRRRFNVVVTEGYGLPETGGLCLCNSPARGRKGSVGKPLRTHDVVIWNEENKEVPAGLTGEIVVRGKRPNTMFLGYSRQPDRTREAWEGGWFHTGDIGYMDADGYIFKERGRG